MKNRKWMNRWTTKLNGALNRLDGAPLWWAGFLFLGITFLPYVILGEGSVFPIHDQLDETLMTYVLNARHLFEGGNAVFPELLGGIRASGMQPSAVLFILLYRFLPVFAAFVVQYLIVSAAGFFGMYGSVKEITGSSILALAAAGCFCLLPTLPVYGLSAMGVPLLLYCFLCLYQGKHVAGSFAGILFFGLTTHLVLIGYVALGFWLLAILWLLAKKCPNRPVILGFLWLTGIYIAVNHSLFGELLLGKSGYTSHREELVNYTMPFWKTVADVFCNSAQHAPSLHRWLILPVGLSLILGLLLRKRLGEMGRRQLLWAWIGLAVLWGIALLYGVCHLSPVVDFKNSCSGFLRYFQLERFYWLYPAGWYLEFMLCFSLWWNDGAREQEEICAGGRSVPAEECSAGKCPAGKHSAEECPVGEHPAEECPAGEHSAGKCPVGKHPVGKCPAGKRPERQHLAWKILALACLLYPVVQEIKPESNFYLNVNQMNNGSGVTGYITWESYYAEELMAQLEDVIGRDMSSYRVAHLGMSPAPSLMHGFYTVDGYSNNYPLEYKHLFRRVIARELEKSEQTRLYFDEWGSRCYLFNGATGNAWMLGKTEEVGYEGLELDMEALRELGCEYIFSAGEIRDFEKMGLAFLGYFETEGSYWGVWLYQL